MTYNLNRIFYNIIRNKISRSTASNNTNHLIKKYTTQISDIKDPFPIFIKKDVHELLKVITRIDINNVIRHRKIGKRIQPPEYKFLTDEQLQKERELALEKVEKNLQMPPILLPNTKDPKQISNDPDLKGYFKDNSKILFFDISQDISLKDRFLYVREPNGVLREGTLDENTRMNTIFFPLQGRKYYVPKMFSSPYLDSLLDREEYEFVLDRACIQFEPDDPLYVEIVQKTYKHINSEKKFDKLRSTRHFGGVAFYLCWWNEIDNLLMDQLLTYRIEESVALIKIYQTLQPQSKIANIKYEEGKDVEFIQSYRKFDSKKKDLLELSIQNYIEYEKERKSVEEGLKSAHGLQATT